MRDGLRKLENVFREEGDIRRERIRWKETKPAFSCIGERDVYETWGAYIGVRG